MSLSSRRAWIEIRGFIFKARGHRSLSSRRAWIEIHANWFLVLLVLSLSSRRAWIEIVKMCYTFRNPQVALLTESVDWNYSFAVSVQPEKCRSPHGERGLKSEKWNSQRKWSRRSPHGERGLKFFKDIILMIMSLSLSSRRAWIEMLIITPGNKGEIGRSPHGERGLKSAIWDRNSIFAVVALLTESVDWNLF